MTESDLHVYATGEGAAIAELSWEFGVAAGAGDLTKCLSIAEFLRDKASDIAVALVSERDASDSAPAKDDFIERMLTAADEHFGIAMCEHNIPVRLNPDGSMLTTCVECSERIKAAGYDDPQKARDQAEADLLELARVGTLLGGNDGRLVLWAVDRISRCAVEHGSSPAPHTDDLNAVLHRLLGVDGPPCETACTHAFKGGVVVNGFTALGVANILKRAATTELPAGRVG